MILQFYKNGSSLILEVSPDEIFAEVVLRYLQKLGLNDIGNLKFFFNSKQLNVYHAKTIEEYEMYNNAIIQVTDTGKTPINTEFLDILFSLNGRKIIVQGQPTDKFCELVKKFEIKADLKPNNYPKYILNSMRLEQNDQRTLKQLKLRHQSRIEVFLETEIIGG